MDTKLEIGKIYQIRVIRQFLSGLHVEMEDGRPGVVREWELTWNQGNLNSWRDNFSPGDILQAIVLKDDGTTLELSPRLAIHDPWDHVLQRYPLGRWVRGSVNGIDEYGGFIELEPGVTAKLHQNQLPDWEQREFREIFWLKDQVIAEVVNVDVKARKIDLSLKKLLDYRWPTDDHGQFHPFLTSSSTQAKVEDYEDEIRLPLEILATQGSQSLLIVEDDPRQNQTLIQRLQQAGHHAKGVPDAESGLLTLAQEAYDIILSDVGLPEMDGIQFLTKVVEKYPQLRTFLMTDWVTAKQRNGEITGLENLGVRLLLKPLSTEILMRVFDQSIAATQRTKQFGLTTNQPSSSTKKHQVSVRKQIQRQLDELRSLTLATQAIIFVMRPEQRQISIDARSGKGAINQTALVHLLYSPVRDALEDGYLVKISDSQQAEGYTRYLQPLVAFRSCLGIPIIGSLATRYAFFLFSPQVNGFDQNAEKIAQAGAIGFGALLEQEVILGQMAEMQRTLLVGHLTQALVHETNHQLGPIVFALEELMNHCTRVERAIDESVEVAHREIRETRLALTSLSTGLNNLVRTTKMFGRMTVHDTVRIVRIDRILGRCMDLLRSIADRGHVILEYEAPSHIQLAKIKETLIQQILLNLLLNAVQQISLTRPKIGGRVRVITRNENSDKGMMIRIAIEDDGPGVHHNQWLRIFDLGMTTRKAEGSGLGLYLAKKLCEEVHGRIYVEESTILWGTRFVIEIPVAL